MSVSVGPPLTVSYRPIGGLPDPRNARTHPKRQVEQIAASIRAYGFTNPILIDADGAIIAGHGRLLAAKAVGLAEVPTIELPHLSEAQQRALRIADNKIALGAGWDLELLKLELGELAVARRRPRPGGDRLLLRRDRRDPQGSGGPRGRGDPGGADRSAAPGPATSGSSASTGSAAATAATRPSSRQWSAGMPGSTPPSSIRRTTSASTAMPTPRAGTASSRWRRAR